MQPQSQLSPTVYCKLNTTGGHWWNCSSSNTQLSLHGFLLPGASPSSAYYCHTGFDLQQKLHEGLAKESVKTRASSLLNRKKDWVVIEIFYVDLQVNDSHGFPCGQETMPSGGRRVGSVRDFKTRGLVANLQELAKTH